MSNRLERANAEIHKTLSEIILYSLNDPRLSQLISVTSVKTAPDFKQAKVLVSVLSQDENERKELFDILKGSATFIRTSLVKKIKLPQAPRINFYLDEGHVNSKRVSEILENLVIPPLEESEE